MKTQTKIGGKVFGEIMINAVSNQSLNLVHSEIILQQNKLVFTNRSGQLITLDVHNIFVETADEINTNKASVTFDVSIDVASTNETMAIKEANLFLNEETIEFYHFELEMYNHEIYSFNVINFGIIWNGFIFEE